MENYSLFLEKLLDNDINYLEKIINNGILRKDLERVLEDIMYQKGLPILIEYGISSNTIYFLFKNGFLKNISLIRLINEDEWDDYLKNNEISTRTTKRFIYFMGFKHYLNMLKKRRPHILNNIIYDLNKDNISIMSYSLESPGFIENIISLQKLGYNIKDKYLIKIQKIYPYFQQI